MRLLNTSTLEPQEFDYGNIPSYAILSHRWGKEEITLQDLAQGVTNKEGFEKVQKCCERAKLDGFNYAWIDTCCINKTSSAELSEAINSMYLWYYQADRCYAYLVDVPSKCKIEDSEWFTRGWTLQELLAPLEVHFVDEHWGGLGTRTDLQEVISGCTGIPIRILSGHDDLETASIAQRMSWAAKRKTQRLEDRAYCLMGIFGINMPLLYGEGERAFIRLQQEIIRVSDDQSLFAWRSSDARGGLLATSPEAFKDSKDVVPFNHFNDPSDPSSVSSRGIHLAARFLGIGPGGLGLAILQCKNRDGDERPIAIYVRDQSWTLERFERVKSNDWELLHLGRFRTTQYPMRRLCIRTGRMTPMRRRNSIGNGDKAAQHHLYSREELDTIMGFTNRSALLGATRSGSQDKVWLLLTRSDIDINSRDLNFGTALQWAVTRGFESIVKMLLARGAKIDVASGRDGETPLSVALDRRYHGVAKLLLENGAAIDEWIGVPHMPPLIYALEHGNDICLIKLLLDKGAAVDSTHHRSGDTSLHLASINGEANVVKLLLDRGADIEAKNDNGLTALSRAALHERHAVVELLLNHGANMETRPTPLALAAMNGHAQIVKLLLRRGAKVEPRDFDGWTPLTLAAASGRKNMVEPWLSEGAEIESRSSRGRTPLALAASWGMEPVVRLLLSQGADINARDFQGKTPLAMAAIQGSEAVVKLLVSQGADLHLEDSEGQTPHMLAHKEGYSAIVKLLAVAQGHS